MRHGLTRTRVGALVPANRAGKQVRPVGPRASGAKPGVLQASACQRFGISGCFGRLCVNESRNLPFVHTLHSLRQYFRLGCSHARPRGASSPRVHVFPSDLAHLSVHVSQSAHTSARDPGHVCRSSTQRADESMPLPHRSFDAHVIFDMSVVLQLNA